MSEQAATWEQAVAVLGEGRTAEAEAMMRGLAAAGPCDPLQREILAKVLHNRAVESFRDGQIDAATTLLREALELKPDLPEARRGLGQLLLARALREAAAEQWSQAAHSAWQAGTLMPDSGGDQALALATRLSERGAACVGDDPILACRLAVAAWALFPERQETYARARSLFIHLGTGELGKPTGTAAFEEILSRDPKDLVALIGLSNLRRRAGRASAAESLCRAALGHWPGSPFAQGRLASILVGQARYQEADRLLREIGQRYRGIEALIHFSPDFVDGLPPVTGLSGAVTASPSGAGPVVFAGCDAGYFHRFADALANSVARYCGGARLHLHVVAPDAEMPARVDAMRQRLPMLDIRITTEAMPHGLAPEQWRTHYACARFVLLPELLAAYRAPVLMLDVDAIVLRDIRPLLAQLSEESADLAMIAAPGADPWARFWADALLAAPSAPSLHYFDSVRRYIVHFLRSGQAVWFLDQAALFAVWAAGQRHGLRSIEWPTDIQNSDTAHAYFWSLHVSQPTNVAAVESDLYRRFKDNLP